MSAVQQVVVEYQVYQDVGASAMQRGRGMGEAPLCCHTQISSLLHALSTLSVAMAVAVYP